MRKLDFVDVDKRLVQLPEWSQKRTCKPALERNFIFSDYLKSIEFVDKVALVAEDLNHHPEMVIGYAKVTLNLTTHDVGGITDKDFELAVASESIYDRLRGK